MREETGARGDSGKHDDFDLQERLDALTELAIWIAAGIAIGLALAVVLRIGGLRWSWALAGLPLAVLAWPLSWLLTGALLVAVSVAALCGNSWQGQDLERGGVEAESARDRRGPLTAFQGRRERQRWRSCRVEDGRFALGETARGKVRTVPFGERQGTRAFVLGAPGSGKTVTLAAHALAYAEAGLPVVCVDPKGDASLRDALASTAKRLGRPFLAWTPNGPATYNPLGRGGPSEIADKALAGEEWSEPHYLRQAQRYLGLEVQALRDAGRWPASLASVTAHLDPHVLDSALDEVADDLALRTRQYLEGLSPRQRAELSGVRDRLAILCESELGPWLEPQEAAPEIELGAAIANRSLVYFQLDSDRYPLASQMLGAAIVVDLVALSGELQGQALRGLVIIDEFAAVAAEEISRLLSRSRSAGLSVLLATQAFADLSVARMGDSTESLRRQVLSHVDYVVAHRQSEPEAADLLGQMAGTKPAWSVAKRAGSSFDPWRSDEELTKRRTREFVRHPDEFKRLGTGRAIVIEPASVREAERVRVWPSDYA